ncbi:hypothetical protein Rsub_01685 [Raphidocelis subcapitata]|uniref:Sulfotransferase domain-containing protein n=1 Tax=Raphidocelis subcapitata TaxID=307507 RepID=A0A2V0NMP7_9CHLO|nr:hypothetical protein Rsub_01685 [Raphidocelis subcapitata]|eukprot:GBF88784.1 hypothetical protein Rsub_01685 [Raphidocelis subcapitata]
MESAAANGPQPPGGGAAAPTPAPAPRPAPKLARADGGAPFVLLHVAADGGGSSSASGGCGGGRSGASSARTSGSGGGEGGQCQHHPAERPEAPPPPPPPRLHGAAAAGDAGARIEEFGTAAAAAPRTEIGGGGDGGSVASSDGGADGGVDAFVSGAPRAAAAAAKPAPRAAFAAAPLPRLHLSHEHPAVLAAESRPRPPAPPPRRPLRTLARVYLLSPLLLPLAAALWLAALAAGLAAALLVAPSLALARRLYWACPFIPYIWRGPARARFGRAGALLLRLQFEGAHCATVVGRLLSLPLRPYLPAFYIAGFPKCGTTSLAAYLRLHPDLAGIAGMPGHEALGKESHFFGGILGPAAAGARAAALYRSFFPTVLTAWWRAAARGAASLACFDATPTFACMPHVAARAAAVTPNAKVVFVVREPTAAVFSAETMLRGMGVPLPWSLAAPPGGGAGDDPEAAAGPQAALLRASWGAGLRGLGERRCGGWAGDAEHDALWAALASLPPDAPLPPGLPAAFYFRAGSYLRGAQYADRLAEWAAHFPPENLMVVDFRRLVEAPESVVREVLAFVGADGERYRFRRLPPGMATNYAGAKMHPATRAAVARRWFAASNTSLFRMLGVEGLPGWGAPFEGDA